MLITKAHFLVFKVFDKLLSSKSRAIRVLDKNSLAHMLKTAIFPIIVVNFRTSQLPTLPTAILPICYSYITRESTAPRSPTISSARAEETWPTAPVRAEDRSLPFCDASCCARVLVAYSAIPAAAAASSTSSFPAGRAALPSAARRVQVRTTQ